MPLPDVHVRIFDGDDGTRVMPAGEVGEIAISAPQLMIGFWNRPDETAGVAARPRRRRRHAPLAAHRRPRLPRRGRLPLHRRSQEGPHQDQRLPGVAARDRRGARVASGGRGGRRRRRARRRQGRGRASVGRAPRRARRRRSRSCGRSAGASSRPTRCRRTSSSGRSCRRRWSARSCAACCATVTNRSRSARGWPGPAPSSAKSPREETRLPRPSRPRRSHVMPPATRSQMARRRWRDGRRCSEALSRRPNGRWKERCAGVGVAPPVKEAGPPACPHYRGSPTATTMTPAASSP